LQRLWSDERARWKTRLLEKVPFAALAIACAVVTFVAQQRAGSVASTVALSVSERGQGAIVACILYVWKAVWPVGLAIFYPRFGAPVWAVIGSAAFLITVTVFALRRIRTRPYVFVGWAWWLIGLAPVLGFVQVGEQAYADRFMYVPLIGLAIVVAWSLADATRNVIGPRVVAVAASLVILACTAAARAQVQTWTDDVTVWGHAVAVTADNYYAESNLGVALGERGDRSGARRHLENALALRPGDADIQNELGHVEAGDGRLEAARERFAAAVLAQPSFAEAHHNLGMTWLRLNAPQQAIDEFTTALALNPSFDLSREGLGHAHAELGRAAALAGRIDDAFAELTESLRWQPRAPDVQCDLAVILRQRGDLAGARAALERALALSPGHPRATRMLESLGR
jgi:protein O-mannosyl-transferase